MGGVLGNVCEGPEADIASHLADGFGDDPCPIAAFARLIRLLAGLVYLLSGAMAVRADILASSGRARVWIILRSVMFWRLRRHRSHVLFATHRTNSAGVIEAKSNKYCSASA